MDSKLFRLPTKPNFYASIQAANPFDIDSKGKQSQLPAPDSRYPGYAGPMSDGRLVTEYRNHCSRNIPVGQQFATKEWMTKNALELIRLSRDRFAFNTGAIYGDDPSVVPPAAMIVDCTRSDCRRIDTDMPGGIGMERAGAPAPELFGTWDSTGSGRRPPAPKISLTQRYEGGRNTPRGLRGPSGPELR